MKIDTRIKLLLVLAAVFITCLTVGDILGGKLIQSQPILGQVFTVTVGMIPFPVTFLITDLLNEFYGKRVARFVTIVGFCMASLAYVFIYVAGAVPFAPFTYAAEWTGVNDASFRNVFLGSQRMIIASMAAYLIAQFCDIGIFSMIKRVTGGRFLWLRATGSTSISQAIDTFVINVVAWYGLMPNSQIMNIMISSYVVKLVIAVGLTPLIYAGHAFVERGLDIAPAAPDPEKPKAPDPSSEAS